MIETITLGNFEAGTALSDDCTVFTLPEGEHFGKLTVYTAFPGITVMYNHFHTDACTASFRYASPIISIDHCRAGRIEWAHANGSFCYLGERDVQISAKEDHISSYGFPTGHYHGITVNFDIQEAQKSLIPFQSLFQIDLMQTYQRFCRQKDFLLRSDEGIQHIFSELYTVQDACRMGYLRLKVLELLLYLSQLNLSQMQTEHPYFQRSVVEKIHQIKADLCRQPGEHRTLHQLSQQYQLPETTIKRCFKAIYGDSLYAFLKTYRLQTSSELLRTTDKSILEIALDIGYENPSKFISAFKKQFGITPAQYRKQKR